MSAKEIFKELGYENNLYCQKDHTIEYLKRKEDEFFGKTMECSITFHKRIKKIKIVGILSYEELQAINKQVEELGWNNE